MLSPAVGYPMNLTGGNSAGFTWTYRADWTGTLGFSATATATDAMIGTPLFTTQVASGVSQTPAALSASVALSATTVFVGQGFRVMVTVTNSGQAAANGLAILPAFPGTGGVALVSGPNPSLPVNIPGGSSMTFTWTFSGASIGPGFFTVTASGADANSGSVVSAWNSSRGMRVELADLTVVGMAVSQSSVGLDAVITVVLSVSNSGSIIQYGVTPQPVVTSGSGELAQVSGPVPATADVKPGETASFTWTFRATKGGEASITGAVTSLSGVSTPPATVVIVIVEKGKGLDNMLVYPSPFKPGEALGGMLKFRQMPPLTVLTIYTVAGERVCELKADLNGTVLWNGRNKNGVRVVPGVYLWLAKTPTGEKRIGKLQVAP
jgi:hypothetical protein